MDPVLVKRLLLVLLLSLAGYVGIPTQAFAQAPVNPCSAFPGQCTQQQAWDACNATADYYRTVQGWELGSASCRRPDSGALRYDCSGRRASDGAGLGCGSFHFNRLQECDGAATWRDDLGRCFDPVECTNRNGAENGMPLDPVSKPFQSKCVAGCELAMQSGSGGCTVIGGVGGNAKFCNGVFQYTGEVCGVDPPPGIDPNDPGPSPGSDACEDVTGTALTFCKKPDGRECWNTRSGAQICWGVGETGQKSDGSEAHTRGPGTQEPTAQLPLPPETFDASKKEGPKTVTTTTYHNNNTTTTTTTTVVSNTTVNGTQAPGTPVKKGSKDAGGNGTGDEEGEGGTQSTDCKKPPTCTLGESIGCAMLRQSWSNFCGAFDGAGSDNLGDFATLDNIPGLDTALAEVWNSGGPSIDPPSLGDLDSGWAARGNCPIQLSFSIPGFRSYTMDGTWFCKILDALASLVVLIASIHSGFILASGFRKGG